MGQEAGLARVTAVGLEQAVETPGSAALGTAGGAGDLWLTLSLPAFNLGHGFEEGC